MEVLSLSCTVLGVLSSFAIISLREREREGEGAGCFACCYMAVSVMCLFLTVLCGSLERLIRCKIS